MVGRFGRRRRNAVHPGREMQPRRGPLRKSLRTLARALDDPSSRLNLFVSVCVVLSTLFSLLETSEEFLALLRAHWPLPAVYFSLEAFCIGVFTLEIVAKLALAKRRLRLLMPLHRDGRAFWIDVAARLRSSALILAFSFASNSSARTRPSAKQWWTWSSSPIGVVHAADTSRNASADNSEAICGVEPSRSSLPKDIKRSAQKA